MLRNLIRNPLVLGFVLFSILGQAVRGTEAEGCNHLQAAYSFDSKFYLIFGDNMVAQFDRWGHQTRDVYQLNYDKPVTAAVGVPLLQTYLFVLGKAEKAYNQFGEETTFAPTAESGAASAIPEDSIDAIVRRKDKLYYFAGCRFLEVDMTGTSILADGYMGDIGLPCNVDAAWHSGMHGTTIIVKGSDIYPWSMRRDKANASVKLLTYFPYLNELNLCE